jgi:hypothetical protein
MAFSTRGREWQRHIVALREGMQDDEDLPALYSDPIYLRTTECKVFISFGDSGCLELGKGTVGRTRRRCGCHARFSTKGAYCHYWNVS